MARAVVEEVERDALVGRVYTLTDPRNDLVRYVGATSVPLEVRLKGHLSASRTRAPAPVARWVGELAAAGLAPRLECVRVVDRGEDLVEAERDQIRRYYTDGWPLLNRADLPGGIRAAGRLEIAERRVAMVEPVGGDLLTEAMEWRAKMAGQLARYRAWLDADRIERERLYPSDPSELDRAIREHIGDWTRCSVLPITEDEIATAIRLIRSVMTEEGLTLREVMEPRGRSIGESLLETAERISAASTWRRRYGIPTESTPPPFA